MKLSLASAGAACAAALVVEASAQSVRAISSSVQDKMGGGKMELMDTSHTGCVESGDEPRQYVLTHLTKSKDHMSQEAMSKDSMGKGDIGATRLIISSQSVDLGEHVGHKVTVTGTAADTPDAMGKDSMRKDTMAKDSMAKDSMAKDSTRSAAFRVKTLKMIASSCQ